jgi:predicted dehydrogenase
MNIAVVGCGYVAEQYANTLRHHTDLRLVGAFDTNPANLDSFVKRTGTKAFQSFDALLAATDVELVLNLTNPRSHFEVNRRALDAGKHVYSEKPLAMTVDEAQSLVAIAAAKGLYLSSAPCSMLGSAAQTLWRAVRDNAVGRVRLVYAAFDDGMIAPNQKPWTWKNESGVPWPAKDEFEIGCTYQHAGYVLTWLCQMFGPAHRVTSFASVQLPDKGIAVDRMAPDFTTAAIEFADGIVARVTCGLVAPRDKSITVVGDSGVLSVGNVRDDGAPVMFRPASGSRWESVLWRRVRPLYRWLQNRVSDAGLQALFASPYPSLRDPYTAAATPDKPVDFLRGPADMAEAIRSGRPARQSGELGAHIVELVERLQYPERFTDRTVKSTFAAIAPMPWADR